MKPMLSTILAFGIGPLHTCRDEEVNLYDAKGRRRKNLHKD